MKSGYLLLLLSMRICRFFMAIGVLCFIFPATAKNLAIEKARILEEVKSTIHDPELAEQIAEIRLRREVIDKQIDMKEITQNRHESGRSTVNVYATDQVTNSNRLETSDQQINLNTRNDLRSYSNSIYTTAGSRFKVGIVDKLSESVDTRYEVSGSKVTDYSKPVNNSIFQLNENNLSLGFYADWHPFDSPLRFTAGMNVNRMRTKLSPAANILNINGNSVNLGSDIYRVEFKFPTLTPYIGVGYLSRVDKESGLHFYGEAGLMLGQYDAVTSTSLIGTQNIKGNDVDSELNKLRSSLYKWNFVPTATFGLQYKFN